MTRLQSEWHRLYLAHPPEPSAAVAVGMGAGVTDRQPPPPVRAMVLSLGKPAHWASVSAIWQAIQADLELPAPAIAVSGVDAYQLWFSLQEAVPEAQAHAFIEGLRQRHLPTMAPDRIGVLTSIDAGVLPGREVMSGQWSAFLAPDLAPMFEETPWLDIPPNPEGQADLLSQVRSIKPAHWQSALARLSRHATAPDEVPAGLVRPGSQVDPRRFLMDVMADDTVALALRIEAAKALLSCP